MNIFVKLKRWEVKIERGPKKKLVHLLLFVFAASLGFGYMVALPIQLVKMQAQAKTTAEIKEIETQRMQKRIEELKQSRYGQK